MKDAEKKPDYKLALLTFILLSLLSLISGQVDSTYTNQFYYQVYIGILYFVHFVIAYKMNIFIKDKIVNRTLYKTLYFVHSVIFISLFYLLYELANYLISDDLLLFYESKYFVIFILSMFSLIFLTPDLETVAEVLEKKKREKEKKKNEEKEDN